MDLDREALGHFFQTAKQKFYKCLVWGCRENAIRAHSIQNARVLDLLVENNHVICPTPKFSKDGPRPEFASIGRNEASTFTGLCEKHDTNIFRPLDTRALDLADAEQLFLIAWRSVTRELHATMEGARRVQGSLNWGVQQGRILPNEDSLPMTQATIALMRSYQVYLYRAENLDRPLAKREFDAIVHDIVEIKHTAPTLAVSTFFSIPELAEKSYFPCAALNVIPLDAKRSALILSYTRKDRRKSRAFFKPLLRSKGFNQKLAISRLVIGRAENFVLSPTFVNKWSEQKKRAILNAFTATIAIAADAPNTTDMMLFE